MKASNEDPFSSHPSRLEVSYENERLTAVIAGASLKEVVQVLGSITGSKFVLIGDQDVADHPIFVQVSDEPFEKALARILHRYSYAIAPMRGSKVLQVTIVLEKGEENMLPLTALSSKTSSLTRSQEGTGIPNVTDDKKISAKSSTDYNAAASVPHDLDEYMPLPDEAPVKFEPDQDAAAEPRLAEARADLEERREQARLERSLSALDSQYDHLRSMAVEELVGMKDPRATRALADLAAAGDAVSNDRRRAALALWHHAADLAFADSAANQALKRLASGSDADPSVKEIAKRALADMERYQRRNNR
jgi:hypothetical protein